MKKNLLAIIIVASSVHASDPSGTYLTWLGYNAGQDGSGNYSSLVGAFSGMGCYNMSRTSAMGVMSAFGSYYLDDCFAAGYRAMQDSSDNYDVIAIGNCAGRCSAGSKNCLWIGRDVGRSTGDEYNTIRFFKNWYVDSGENYYPDASSVANNVFFFGVTLYDIVTTLASSDWNIPTNLSEFENDCGFLTNASIPSILYNNDVVTYTAFFGHAVMQYSSDNYGGSSTMKITEDGDYAFANNNGDIYSSNYGIRFNRDNGNSIESLGFSDSTKRNTRVIEEVKEDSIISINANASLLAHDGSTVWLQDPNDVLVGGTNMTSAAFLPNYVRSIADIQSVNGKTGMVTLTASDVNALPAFPTNTIVRLITDDDAMAALRLILTTMGATVVTNSPSASN